MGDNNDNNSKEKNNSNTREIQMIKTGDKTLSTPKKVRFMNQEDHLNTNSINKNNNKDEDEEGIKTRMKSSKAEEDNDQKDMNHDTEMARQKKNDYISSLFPNSTSPIENVSFDGSDVDVDDHVLDGVPLPPFSPGVPGLLSPLPRRPNYGASPPLPPGIRRV